MPLVTVNKRPDVIERVVALMDPSRLPEAERPADLVTSWWHWADWAWVQTVLDWGWVVELSVEPHRQEAALTAAMYECGDLVSYYNEKDHRLLIQRKQFCVESSQVRMFMAGDTDSVAK